MADDDWYWPLGALDFANEIRESFSEQAEMLGIINILWNRQELALRRIFLKLVASPRQAFVEAIWDRQPTHQAKRDLIALALSTARLTKTQRGVLEVVLAKTKTMADRRNELIHGEYVVHARTKKLHAAVKAPRSTKPPRHQKLDVADLEKVVTDLERLLGFTEVSWFHFSTRTDKKLQNELKVWARSNGFARP